MTNPLKQYEVIVKEVVHYTYLVTAVDEDHAREVGERAYEDDKYEDKWYDRDTETKGVHVREHRPGDPEHSGLPVIW